MSETVDAKIAKQTGEPARRKPRGTVTVFPNWCKGCWICVEFCPAGVLERGTDDHVQVAHPERCIGCTLCELRCPDFAIFVIPKDNHEEDE
jgi:2-oxoglutarate ferredoxin oxidoreductase subunit delta